MFKKIISSFLLIIMSISINAENFYTKNYSYIQKSDKVMLKSIFTKKIYLEEMVVPKTIDYGLKRNILNDNEKLMILGMLNCVYVLNDLDLDSSISIEELIKNIIPNNQDKDLMMEILIRNMPSWLFRSYKNGNSNIKEIVCSSVKYITSCILKYCVDQSRVVEIFMYKFNAYNFKKKGFALSVFCSHIVSFFNKDMQYKIAENLALYNQEILGNYIKNFDKLDEGQRYKLAYTSAKINGYLVLKYLDNFNLQTHPKFYDLLLICAEFNIDHVYEFIIDNTLDGVYKALYGSTIVLHQERAITNLFEYVRIIEYSSSLLPLSVKFLPLPLPIIAHLPLSFITFLSIFAKIFLISYKNNKVSYKYLPIPLLKIFQSRYYSFSLSLFCDNKQEIIEKLQDININEREVVISFVKKITGKNDLNDIKIGEYNYAGIVLLLFEFKINPQNKIEYLKKVVESNFLEILKYRVLQKPLRLKYDIAKLLVSDYVLKESEINKHNKLSHTEFNKIVLEILFKPILKNNSASPKRGLIIENFISNIGNIDNDTALLEILFSFINNPDISDADKFNIIEKINILLKNTNLQREKIKIIIENLRYVNFLIKFNKKDILSNIDFSQRENILKKIFFEQFPMPKTAEEKFNSSVFNDPYILSLILIYKLNFDQYSTFGMCNFELFPIFVQTVLEGTFKKFRIEQSTYLQEVFKYMPDLKSAFQQDLTITINSENNGNSKYSEIIKEKLNKLGIKSARISLTDDPVKLLCCAERMIGSCLKVSDYPGYSCFLLGYILDGKIKIITLEDEKGNVIARCMLKLLFDQENRIPVLLQEYIYFSKHKYNEYRAEFSDILSLVCREFAERLRVPLTVNINNYIKNNSYDSVYLSLPQFYDFSKGIVSFSNPYGKEDCDVLALIPPAHGKTTGRYFVPSNLLKLVYAPFNELIKIMPKIIPKMMQSQDFEDLGFWWLDEKLDRYISLSDPFYRDTLLAIKCAS
jgi:hypothetical protein